MFKSKMVVLAGVLTVSGGAYADLNTGLMAHYTFDNCQATDSSGNNNNGTITGTLQCVKGMNNKALLFDGASYISIPNSASLNPDKEWTMALWIRVDGFTNDYSAIIHKGGPYPPAENCESNREYSLWLNTQLGLATDSMGSDGTCVQSATWTKKPVNIGEWQYFVGVIDRNKQISKIYLNGVLKATLANNYNGFVNNNFDLRIGSTEEIAPWISPFKGELDDVRFYNRVLSGAEINALYNITKIKGSVNGLQQYSVTCTNTTTGKSETIPLKDGFVGWNCNTAGLKSKKGDVIDIHLNGISW